MILLNFVVELDWARVKIVRLNKMIRGDMPVPL